MDDDIIGIIPSGGLGKRMKPFRAFKELTTVGSRIYESNGEMREIPKVLGEYTIENMVRAGVSNLVIVINENKSELLRFYGNGSQYKTNIVYACQDMDSDLYGMPVAFEEAYPWIRNKTVFMGMPDTIVLPFECFEVLYDVHKENKSDLTLGVFPTDNPQSLAPVEYDLKTKRVLKIYDKPKEIDINNTWNIAIWSKRFTELIHEYYCEELSKVQDKKEIILSDIFNLAIHRNFEVFCHFFAEGQCFDLGNIKEYNSTKLMVENSSLLYRNSVV
ncbi:hypothetical protein EHE19_014480 [Ruminiclostridium herbifermentans]|uniref:Glucose-1-phosphate thymidylyltransferase n=1 Tax=Ruminiclostridium herbifermentans TaxID=2488810 RepID=A0A7H1VL17_9FIRM|nr:sugar phosphate nucleotidyltransferase [Ruminiclostridium herbifermentans]QNU66079.1 hypothetical protein EHE19_014480 [Ruminiclostridium herbifermentans]